MACCVSDGCDSGQLLVALQPRLSSRVSPISRRTNKIEDPCHVPLGQRAGANLISAWRLGMGLRLPHRILDLFWQSLFVGRKVPSMRYLVLSFRNLACQPYLPTPSLEKKND
jgi:hypothetical protein